MADRVFSGRYRILRHLARGGMAEVYIAHDELLSRTVAVKVLFPELAQDQQFVERFRREAQAAASLNHHNIVSVYDFGEDEDSWFIVMEYVRGPNLRDIILADGPIEPARATQIAAEVAAALGAAHAQGIVHRDVKPANVLIADAGGTIKVADFGIARAANVREALTMPGTVLGTATYLSPEQAQGEAVDARTDIYSLGMVLYEMLAGKPPFTGDSPVAVAYQAVRNIPPAPSTRNAAVPPELDRVVMQAMAKDPAARQQTAEQLRAELLAVDRAAGDPEATVAAAPPVPVAEPGATQVIAGSSTSVLPPVPVTDPGGAVVESRAVRAGPGPGPGPGVYRRRRAAVLAALAAIVLLVVVVALAARNGGATVTVPKEVGKATADAQADLTSAGLQSKVTPQDAPTGTPDQVLSQNPAAGTKVKKSSTVELFVPSASSTTTTVATTSPPATRATTTTTAATTTTEAPTTTVAPVTVPPTVAPTTSVVVVPTSPLAVTTTSRP